MSVTHNQLVEATHVIDQFLKEDRELPALDQSMWMYDKTVEWYQYILESHRLSGYPLRAEPLKEPNHKLDGTNKPPTRPKPNVSPPGQGPTR